MNRDAKEKINSLMKGFLWGFLIIAASLILSLAGGIVKVFLNIRNL